MFRALTLCFCVLSLSAIAGDKPNLAQKKGWATYEKELEKKTVAVNKACGTKVKSVYDKTSYPAFDPLKDRTQSACQMAVGTLAEVCRTDEGKESVKEKISKTTCRLSTEGTKVTLSSGELIIHIDPERSSIVGKEPGSYSWISAIKEVL